MTVTILAGDCREILKQMPDASVHCCVTSPPYYGLRDYGVDGQMGLEPSLHDYIAEMVAVFREVRRVLRDDGTCWLNIGDSYAGSWGAQDRRDTFSDDPIWHGSQIKNHPKWARNTGSIRDIWLKPKDMMMVPSRLAIALQDDGWWLRKDIIWHKPNPMPESINDRPTSSHEHVFLLAKSGTTQFWTHRDGGGARAQPDPDYRWISRATQEEVPACPPGWPEDDATRKAWRRVNLWEGADYFYDGEAVRESRTSKEDAGEFRGGSYVRDNLANDELGKRTVIGNRRLNVPCAWDRGQGSHGTIHRDGRTEAEYQDAPERAGRNLRDVWTIASVPFREAHFATFPPRLAEICILAGTSARGCCSVCGAPWARIVAMGEPDADAQRASGGDTAGEYHGASTKGHAAAGVQDASAVKARILAGMRERTTIGWSPTCECRDASGKPHAIVHCTVLDPFGGAGTTGLVAARLQRSAILVELNADYVAMARRRISEDAPLLVGAG